MSSRKQEDNYFNKYQNLLEEGDNEGMDEGIN
jgi:hypothetical protein